MAKVKEPASTPIKVLFKRSNLFKENFHDKYLDFGESMAARVEAFQEIKSADPLQPFGGSDTPFVGGGLIKNAVPGEVMRHAHITQDLSIIYSLTGNDPKVIKLYALMSHQEMGTGNTANIKKQKNLAKKLSNQSFS